MTAVTISFSDAGSDLKAYLSDWIGEAPISGYGDFSPATPPHSQWVAGGEGAGSDYSVILDGTMSDYQNGDLTGSVDTLSFGTGLTGDAATGFTITDVDMTIDLHGNDAIQEFDYTIYGLVTENITLVYDYFDAVGTEQISTSGDDTMYGFASVDTFVFGDDSGWDTIQDFEAGDLLDVSGWGVDDIGDLTTFTYSDDTYIINSFSEVIILEDVASVSSSDFIFA